MKRKKRRKRLNFRRAFAFVMLWALAFILVSGAEITLEYNKTKAKRVRATFWGNTMKVVRYVGDIRYALWR